jgi:8-oxo-dGTP diphosphatase
MSKLIRVVAAVIRHEHRFLLCKRPEHKRHGGLWEFPGGKCEVGESDKAAIARELLEELGVITTNVGRELLALNDPDSPFLIVFIEVSIEGTPVCKEHPELAWYALDELGAIRLAPSDKRFVDALISRAVLLPNP